MSRTLIDSLVAVAMSTVLLGAPSAFGQVAAVSDPHHPAGAGAAVPVPTTGARTLAQMVGPMAPGATAQVPMTAGPMTTTPQDPGMSADTAQTMMRMGQMMDMMGQMMRAQMQMMQMGQMQMMQMTQGQMSPQAMPQMMRQMMQMMQMMMAANSMASPGVTNCMTGAVQMPGGPMVTIPNGMMLCSTATMAVPGTMGAQQVPMVPQAMPTTPPAPGQPAMPGGGATTMPGMGGR